MEKVDIPRYETRKHVSQFTVCIVPRDEVGNAWEMLDVLFQTGPEEYSSPWHRAVIRQQLENGEADCWLVHDSEELVGAWLSEVVETAFTKELRIVWGTAKRVEEHLGLGLLAAEDFAAENGCAKIVFTGRWGWVKLLARFGYERTAVVFEKKIIRQRSN